MADSTDPTGAPTDDGSLNRYVVRATVIDDTIRLSGDIVDDTIEVPRGEDAIIKIKDTDEYYLYAVEVPTNGGRSRCWGRNLTRRLTRRMFEDVHDLTHNFIYAVEKSARGKIVYGPVVVVKPKG